jgi:hypothetical protein
LEIVKLFFAAIYSVHDKLIAGLSAAHAGFHHRGFTV